MEPAGAIGSVGAMLTRLPVQAIRIRQSGAKESGCGDGNRWLKQRGLDLRTFFHESEFQKPVSPVSWFVTRLLRPGAAARYPRSQTGTRRDADVPAVERQMVAGMITAIRCVVVAFIVINCVGFAMADPVLRDWATMMWLISFLVLIELVLWRARERIRRQQGKAPIDSQS